MPSKNTVREFEKNQFYHVYNRGVEKRDIFIDDEDFTVFLGLLKKYLTGKSDFKTHRHKFIGMENKVQLLAYCLMPNHFHLLFYQFEAQAIPQLMKKVSVSYVAYFNEKYHRVGSLFQGRYKAAHINADGYLHHISRYIHMNPEHYKDWPYSSLVYYSGKKVKPVWLQTKPVLELFDDDTAKYLEFVADYKDSKEELSILKWQLANETDL